MNERARKGKGISTFIMLLFVLSAFSALLISVYASDSLPYTDADLGTGIYPCSDEAQAIVDNATTRSKYTPLDRDEDSICNCRTVSSCISGTEKKEVVTTAELRSAK